MTLSVTGYYGTATKGVSSFFTAVSLRGYRTRLSTSMIAVEHMTYVSGRLRARGSPRKEPESTILLRSNRNTGPDKGVRRPSGQPAHIAIALNPGLNHGSNHGRVA